MLLNFQLNFTHAPFQLVLSLVHGGCIQLCPIKIIEVVVVVAHIVDLSHSLNPVQRCPAQALFLKLLEQYLILLKRFFDNGVSLLLFIIYRGCRFRLVLYLLDILVRRRL